MKNAIIKISTFSLLMLMHTLNAAERPAAVTDLIGAWRGSMKMPQGPEILEYQMLLICDGENLSMIEKQGTSSRSMWNDGQYKLEEGKLTIFDNGKIKDTMQMRYNDETDTLIMIDSGQSMTLSRMIPKS